MTSICKCGTVREKLTSSENAKFPGRHYYKCSSCERFDWADQTPKALFNNEAGPDCKCGKASVQRAVTKLGSPNKGKKFWCCAKGRDGGCGFFEWVKNESQVAGAATAMAPRKLDFSEKKRPATPGYATYLSDWKKAEVLQRMFEVDPKFMMFYTHSRYDSLEVVGTWKISNQVQQEQFDEARSKIKRESPNDNSDYDIPESYGGPMSELANTPLDKEAGEVFLLHGTRPENLHSILFDGHKTELSQNGLFGRGIYFAENAAKIDQYSTNDERYQSEGNVAELHKRIYKESKCMHPHNVRYALVCRVLLGQNITTKDAKNRIDDGMKVFTNEKRNSLADLPNGKTPSSLIAFPGEVAQKFREFVVYDSSQVCVEYLVAYKRVRNLCDCGVPCIERTVVKQTENRGRKIHLCSKEKDDSCNFMQMLPLCNCGKSANVKTSHSAKNPGRSYYSCHSRYGRRCDFFEWKNDHSAASPYKKTRNA